MDAVEEIKGRLSIEDVVGRVVDLKRSGASLKGLCPFHQEKTPSFYVSPSRGTYHCFGCGKGGDVFSFVMESERVAFPEALKELADQTGVKLPEREPKRPSLRSRLFEVNEAAARFYAQTLASSHGRRATRYLEHRGFDSRASSTFGLGYAPNGRDGLVQALIRAGFDDRIILAAGLALQDDSGSSLRDRFRGRLMFPIQDQAGKTVGFGARALEDDQQPKYLNSPQTEIFDKSSVLFGIAHAAEAIRAEGRAVLVEGYLDAVRAHLAGYRSTVASLGTAVTSQQLVALKRLTDTVVLALDPDPAGQAAAARTSLSALADITHNKGRTPGAAAALDLRIARLPVDSGDPDDLLRSHPEAWEEAIASSIPAFDFYFSQVMGTLDRSTDSWRQEAIDRLLPVIQQLSTSTGWQAVWLERLASETGVNGLALQRSLPMASSSRNRQRPSERGQEVVTATTARGLSSNPVETVERSLLTLLLKIVVIPDTVYEQVRELVMARPEHQSLLRALLDWRSHDNFDYEMFREDLDEELAAYADQLRSEHSPLPGDGKVRVAIQLHLTRLRHAQLEERYNRVAAVLKEMAAEDQPAALSTLSALMAEHHALDEELDRLSLESVQAR